MILGEGAGGGCYSEFQTFCENVNFFVILNEKIFFLMFALSDRIFCDSASHTVYCTYTTS